MENLQEPWTEEEWDAYVQRVLTQGDPGEGDDPLVLPPVRWDAHAFDPNHPVPASVRADPEHPLNRPITITQEE